MEQIRLFNDDCLTAMKQLEDNSVDSIVTDPPYHLTSIVKRFGKEGSAPAQFGTDGAYARASKGFLGKEWDGGDISFRTEIWEECLRVLKPGGHLLSFSHSRTYHRMAVAIEDAGFEIRDQIMWVYGSGFPKSYNIGKAIDKLQGNERDVVGEKVRGDIEKAKENCVGYLADPANRNNTKSFGYGTHTITKGNSQYEGWGTALKPAHEPIVMARKPFKGSVAENVLKYGTGGINIDESRIGNEVELEGRWPANIIFDEEAGKILDEQSSEASRFFYCPKANKKDRDEGINNLYLIENNLICEIETLNQQLKDISEDMIKIMENKEWNTILFGSNITDQYQQDFKFITSIILKMIIGLKTLNYYPHLNTKDYIVDVIKMIKGNGLSLVDYVEQINLLKQNITNEKMEYHLGVVSAVLPTLLEINKKGKTGNFHATVKPTKLMEYLIKLVTPKNGIVLDPFMGSGSTGKAAIKNNFGFIGIEREKEYFEIAKNRIEYENTLNYPIEINQDEL